MKVRRAKKNDLEEIKRLLQQVHDIHYRERPDLFKEHTRKYTDEMVLEIINDDRTPVFVAVDGSDTARGYAFCVFRQHINDTLMTDIKTLYIDDLCVEENLRGKHIGKTLYNAVLDFAREHSCYNVTLNVWECNDAAKKFYKSLGLIPQKTTMEIIL